MAEDYTALARYCRGKIQEEPKSCRKIKVEDCGLKGSTVAW